MMRRGMRVSQHRRQQFANFVSAGGERACDSAGGINNHGGGRHVRAILFRNLTLLLQEHLAKAIPRDVYEVLFDRAKADQGNRQLLAVGLLPLLNFGKQGHARSASWIRENEQQWFAVSE